MPEETFPTLRFLPRCKHPLHPNPTAQTNKTTISMKNILDRFITLDNTQRARTHIHTTTNTLTDSTEGSKGTTYTVTLILTRMLLLLPTDICSSSSDTLMDKQKRKIKLDESTVSKSPQISMYSEPQNKTDLK